MSFSSPRPVAAAGQLHSSLTLISRHTRIHESTLLALDQSTCEQVFVSLLGRLGLPHLGSLVSARVNDRLNDRMAGKIGHSESGKDKSEEEKYRRTFTKLILAQCVELGFKGVINPDLNSLVTDRKLCIRLMDHLARRAFPPTSAADANRGDADRSPQTVKRRTAGSNRAPERTAAAAAATPPSAPAAAPHAPSAMRASNEARREMTPARRTQQNTNARPAVADTSVEDVTTHKRNVHASKQVHQDETTYPDDFTPINSDADKDGGAEGDDGDDMGGNFSFRSVYDGRFADHEFDPNSIGSASSSRPATSMRRAANSNTARPAKRNHQRASKDEEAMTAEELRAELQAERARHHATALELQSLTSLYSQLIDDRRSESFSTRRVMLLKSQNMQLERQVSLLSDNSCIQREAMHEMGTLLNGVEAAIHSATPTPDTRTGTNANATEASATRKIRQLEQSLEAARQRLEKYARNEIKYSRNEEQYLSNSAPPPIDSIYSGLTSHLNLSRVHSLEGRLSEVHELLTHCHGMISSIAVATPIHQRLHAWSKHQTDKTTIPTPGGVQRLPALLDSLRFCAFELQSLGVHLPTSSAAASLSGSSNHFTGVVADQRRDWSWITHLRHALRRKGVPASQVDTILTRASQEERYVQLKIEMYERELTYHRRLQNAQVQSVMALLRQTREIVARFHTNNNALFHSASRELSELVSDWPRNSASLNVTRLLTLMQSIFPSVKQLLTDEHRAADVTSSIEGLPDVAAELQFEIDQEVRAFRTRLQEVQELQIQIDEEIQQAEQQQQQQHPTEQHADTVLRQDQGRARLSSSSGRGPATNPHADLPPFQF